MIPQMLLLNHHLDKIKSVGQYVLCLPKARRHCKQRTLLDRLSNDTISYRIYFPFFFHQKAANQQVDRNVYKIKIVYIFLS